MNKEKHTNKEEKKGLATMTIILMIIGILVVAFTITMIWVHIKTGNTPDTLITCFFVATTGEFGVMGWIRTTKDRDKKRQYDLEDREYLDSKNDKKGADEPWQAQ